MPKFYGLYCYQTYELKSILSNKTNIRLVIMNNILPTDIPIHEKFDLKGSIYRRKASKEELAKKSPTFKDLDFLSLHPEGLTIHENYYENIVSSLRRDCSILESFGIMDYSMLLGIHNLEKERVNKAVEAYYEARVNNVFERENESDTNTEKSSTSNKFYSLQKKRASILTLQKNMFNLYVIFIFFTLKNATSFNFFLS